MDTEVNNIVDDKYTTASSGWLQVSRQGTAKGILHIALCVCVCVCARVRVLGFGTVWNSFSSELLDSF
jgi:hypothetical protein